MKDAAAQAVQRTGSVRRRSKEQEAGWRSKRPARTKGRRCHCEHHLWPQSRLAAEPQRHGDHVRDQAKDLDRTGRPGRPIRRRPAGARGRSGRPRRSPQPEPGSLPRTLSRCHLGGRGDRAAQHPLERARERKRYARQPAQAPRGRPAFAAIGVALPQKIGSTRIVYADDAPVALPPDALDYEAIVAASSPVPDAEARKPISLASSRPGGRPAAQRA